MIIIINANSCQGLGHAGLQQLWPCEAVRAWMVGIMSCKMSRFTCRRADIAGTYVNTEGTSYGRDINHHQSVVAGTAICDSRYAIRQSLHSRDRMNPVI
jgi:hypothetical protein